MERPDSRWSRLGTTWSGAVALLRDCRAALRRLILQGQADAFAPFGTLGDLDGRISAFLAEPAPSREDP